MSILKQKVSLFSSYKDADPKTVMLYDFITSDKFKNEVDVIRSTNNKALRNSLKSRLPAITPSGLFNERRSISNLVKHTGLIQVDIDKQDNEHLKMCDIKEILKDIEQICFASYSVSGNGLFGLIEVSNPEKHKEHFLALEEDFKNDFNIIIDKSCKDVSRLRGYTFDDDFYINENALIYDQLIHPKEKTKHKPKVIKLIHESITKEDDFYKALEVIERNRLDITGSNEQWFDILCSIANEFGESGRGFAHVISQYSNLYDYSRCDKDYSRAINNSYSYSIGTFYYFLKQHLTA
ncbi:hypothetical protein F6U93_07845 [Tamlana haliotis]|uniref:VirE protein n=1 Tax=Pseudotamlana haliotis TaxID=2614804 RepID=A0A6N6MGV9_9FLAO|nr:BT4734/BF3469 family protein [Tamlana haliotis]KAB1068040.1 hypothetical protein F6U93_07845 [Tamlana haliotis]